MTINIYCQLNRLWNHWIYKLLSISMKKYQVQINWNGDSYPKHGGTNPWPRLLTEYKGESELNTSVHPHSMSPVASRPYYGLPMINCIPQLWGASLGNS